jgi:hypothetical protein
LLKRSLLLEFTYLHSHMKNIVVVRCNHSNIYSGTCMRLGMTEQHLIRITRLSEVWNSNNADILHHSTMSAYQRQCTYSMHHYILCSVVRWSIATVVNVHWFKKMLFFFVSNASFRTRQRNHKTSIFVATSIYHTLLYMFSVVK